MRCDARAGASGSAPGFTALQPTCTYRICEASRCCANGSRTWGAIGCRSRPGSIAPITPRALERIENWYWATFSLEAFVAAHPELTDAEGVTVFGDYAPCEAARIEVRSFAPLHGINEDPVCGSGNGCVAAFLRETGQTARIGMMLLSSQGQVLGRAGRVRLSLSPDRITVGGQSVTCVEGRLRCN